MKVRPICCIQDCPNPARSYSAELCPKHYHRQYRHGNANLSYRRSGIGKANATQYRRVLRRGHPLADKYNRLWEHRAVLYDSIGPGPARCHYCQLALSWSVDKFDPSALQVDHLNARRDDNRPENLVPCCRRCNVARGQAGAHQRLKAAGFWSGKDTQQRRRVVQPG